MTTSQISSGGYVHPTPTTLPTNNGGPAFPNLGYNADKNYNGMSLRDYFAGQAVAGLLAQPAEPEYGLRYFARSAYLMADEMLKAREII
jgi:hypothetical protein